MISKKIKKYRAARKKIEKRRLKEKRSQEKKNRLRYVLNFLLLSIFGNYFKRVRKSISLVLIALLLARQIGKPLSAEQMKIYHQQEKQIIQVNKDLEEITLLLKKKMNQLINSNKKKINN